MVGGRGWGWGTGLSAPGEEGGGRGSVPGEGEESAPLHERAGEGFSQKTKRDFGGDVRNGASAF